MRLLPIFQSASQVRELYGDEAAKAFFQNHPLRIAYTPPDMATATELSRELGTYTYKATSMSRPSTLAKGSRSLSESDHARALLLPQEVKELGEDEALILAKGCKPIRADKLCWYRDPAFKDRPLPAPQLAPAPLTVYPLEPQHFSSTNGGSENERSLSDFNLDLSDVQIPSGEISEAEAEALADQLYAAMTR